MSEKILIQIHRLPPVGRIDTTRIPNVGEKYTSAEWETVVQNFGSFEAIPAILNDDLTISIKEPERRQD